jgi:hypothetical protein
MSPALTACIHQSWKWSRKRRLRLYDFWLQGGGAFYSVSKPLLMKRGTGGSNPLPSSGESRANLTFDPWRWEDRDGDGAMRPPSSPLTAIDTHNRGTCFARLRAAPTA